jgi:hypothetical protein
VSNFWGKQRSSYPIRINELDWTGSGTLVSTTFGQETHQIRVVSDVRGYLAFSSTSPTSANRDTATVEIMPNQVGEYFTVRPGNNSFVAWSSSSTSSGSILITEMS